MLESNGNMYMPVAPAYSYGNGGNCGMFGGDWAWIILLLLLGWGNNGNGFGGGGMNGLYPWMNQSDSMNAGFRGVQIDSQMAAIQNAVNNGFQNLTSQFAQCCCDNKLAVADLKYTVATENCADRTALREVGADLLMNDNNNTQRLIDTFTNGIGGIMNKICQLELDAKNDKIAALQAELNEANRRASQETQTAQILASQAAQTAALEQYLAPTPRPAYIVQNPNCCTQNYGCGCGCGQ